MDPAPGPCTAEAEAKSLTVSELSVVDSRGVIRARLGGELPDAVVGGKVPPRGNHAAGLLIYDGTGQERGGYVTFEPSGNVALTLDNRSGQTAAFVTDPEIGSALRLHWTDDDVELRVEVRVSMQCAGRTWHFASRPWRTRNPLHCAKVFSKRKQECPRHSYSMRAESEVLNPHVKLAWLSRHAYTALSQEPLPLRR